MIKAHHVKGRKAKGTSTCGVFISIYYQVNDEFDVFYLLLAHRNAAVCENIFIHCTLKVDRYFSVVF